VLRGVLAFIKRHGPFDALAGFGQGGVIAMALSGRAVAQEYGHRRTWTFVILAHAVLDDLPTVDAIMKRMRKQKWAISIFHENRCDLPLLNIVGMGDVPRRELSMKVAKSFIHKTNVFHNGKTLIPAEAREDPQFAELVDAFCVQPFLC